LWWPEDEFLVGARQQLVFRIEQLHAEQPLDAILGIGVRRAGFAAAVAGRLTGVPTSIFLTYRDAFQDHFAHPQDLDLVVRHAANLVAANVDVLAHLNAFYPLAEKALWLCAEPQIEPPDRLQDAAAEPTEARLPFDAPYFVTTGELNEMTHLAELLGRVRERLSGNRNMRWLHVGISAPMTHVTIREQLVLLGLEDRFHEAGTVPRSTYFNLLAGAETWLVADGERNTRISELEAKAWQIRQELPAVAPRSPTQSTFLPATLPDVAEAVAA